MNIKQLAHRLKAGLKGFTGGYDWVDSDNPGNRRVLGNNMNPWIAGTGINWEAVAGDLWSCPAVQSCLSWKWRNWAQAPPIVQEQNAEGTWEVVPDHPLLALLDTPNPYYDGTILMQGAILSLDLFGNAFIGIERTRGGAPGEFYYLPNFQVTVRSLADTPQIIDHYEYNDGRKMIKVPPEDMLHLRFGINPYDTRMGLAPIQSGQRDGYSLQRVSNYTANILRNFGAALVYASPKNPSVAFEPAEFTKLHQQMTGGDNAGKAVAFSEPMDLQFPGVTPQDMALNDLADRPESNICALLGLPPQVVGMHVGRLAKTYANAQQAKEAAWEEGMMPLGYLIATQTWHKLGPQIDREAYQRRRLAYDYSQVRALQPDLDALYKRANDAWKLNAISLEQWHLMVGSKPKPGDENVYYRDVAGGPAQPDSIPSQAQGDIPVKGRKIIQQIEQGPTDWAERVAAELEVLHGTSA